MTYAITVETPLRGRFNVYCAQCRDDLGVMTGLMIQRAIMHRGPVLCPQCRERHCDYCGRVKSFKPGKVIPPYQEGLARICTTCYGEQRHRTPPKRMAILEMGRIIGTAIRKGATDVHDINSDCDDIDLCADCRQSVEEYGYLPAECACRLGVLS